MAIRKLRDSVAARLRESPFDEGPEHAPRLQQMPDSYLRPEAKPSNATEAQKLPVRAAMRNLVGPIQDYRTSPQDSGIAVI